MANGLLFYNKLSVAIDLLILRWWDVLETWWWLRSTTSSYGRLVLEATYGKMVISLYRGCLGDVSLGKVVGVSTWLITHGRHTQVNTSVGTIYNIFLFSWYEINPISIMFLKPISIIKEHWWSLTLSWPIGVQRMFFDLSWVLKKN